MRATMRRRSSRTQMMTVRRLQRRPEGHMLPCCAAGSCGHSHRCVLPPATRHLLFACSRHRLASGWVV